MWEIINMLTYQVQFKYSNNIRQTHSTVNPSSEWYIQWYKEIMEMGRFYVSYLLQSSYSTNVEKKTSYSTNMIGFHSWNTMEGVFR